MAEQLTIARPYARAVFAQALANSQLAEWQVVLEALAVVVSKLGDACLIGNPSLSTEQLKKCCLDVVKSVVAVPNEDELNNFISLLLAEKRLKATAEIAQLFHQLVIEHNKTVEVSVEFALALTDEQKASLVAALEQKFNQKVTITYQENPDLIGGFVAKSKNWVFDGSIRSKLQRLAERII